MISNEIAIYRRLFDNKYRELYDLLDGLPDEALLWKPFEQSPWRGGCNSIGAVVAHGISSTVYLLRRAEWQVDRRRLADVDGDEGSEEFSSANHSIEYLRARVERTHALVHAMLDEFTPAELAGTKRNPNVPERPFTVRFDIQHAIEHLSEHIGHGQLTRQLWACETTDTPE